jgi:hypothetical protein
MAYKIKRKSESQLMMEKNNRLMLKMDREREAKRIMEAYAKANGLKIQWKK